MMDDALLRPGRLEVQIEIGLPKVRGPSFTSLFNFSILSTFVSGMEPHGLRNSAEQFLLECGKLIAEMNRINFV